MALGIRRLDPTGIDEHRQLADFAAGEKVAITRRRGTPAIRPGLLQEAKTASHREVRLVKPRPGLILAAWGGLGQQ
jgi:hypothetical protein